MGLSSRQGQPYARVAEFGTEEIQIRGKHALIRHTIRATIRGWLTKVEQESTNVVHPGSTAGSRRSRGGNTA
jgi:hypothetical protein